MKSLDRFIQRRRIRKVQPYLPAGARLLDIGASDGALFSQLRGIAEYVGIEPELPETRRLAPSALLIRGFFPEALENREPFDVIAMLAVLEHIPPAEQEHLARACADFLKPGGILVITVPSPMTDHVLWLLKSCGAIDGMSLEQHYGFKPKDTPEIFGRFGFRLVKASKFQLGLNNLFVFEKNR